MKRQIRRNVFETNSSSVHSIAITPDGREPSNLPINEQGKIEVALGYFGKEDRLYTEQIDKLSYLMTCIYYMYCQDCVDMVEQREFQLIEKTLCKYSGAAGIEVVSVNNAYLDHQSIPYGSLEIINVWDEDEILNFVFNKNVMLRTGCD